MSRNYEKHEPGNPVISRRTWLKQGLAGALGLGLCARGDALTLPPARPARAKSVIQIWMWGGPSHLDTFDPKPEAGYDYCGPWNKPIETNVPGIRISQMLPRLARQADKYTIIRSMTHDINAHETASYMVQTGWKPGGLGHPCAGAVVSLFRGYDSGYKGLIPPYIVLTKPQGRFSEAGFLGLRYKPFATGGDPKTQPFAVEGVVAPGITRKHQQQRRELLHALDSLGNTMPGNPRFAQLDACEEKAYDLILGDAGKVFDLSEEPDDIRSRYGRNTFGQACLAARRLVEKGVPYITINYMGGWDTHKNNFQVLQRKLPEMDQGMATLLQDLADRGLLDSTIVWWGGEFGRTPKISWEPPWNGGRGHHGQCFSAVVAGGGFKGGQVVGASDARGEEVAKRPVYPGDLLGSIYQLLGIEPEEPLPNDKGLTVPVLPGKKDGAKSGGRLTEIMKV